MEITPRRIGRVNWQGLKTLTGREIGRFMNVATQTVFAPVMTTVLFYAIFALTLDKQAEFLAFLAPGLVMMAMMQNAFANSTSSLIIAKMQGNIVDILIAPLSPVELCIGYITGGVARGLMVGLACTIVLAFFAPIEIKNSGPVVVFAILGTTMLSILGLLTGLWAEKFDHMAAMTNFVITPLTFLSGTFYMLEKLPLFWQTCALYNPFFYIIDGFRAGFTGVAEGNLWIGAIYLTILNMLLMIGAWTLVRSGYKIQQ